MTKNILLFSLSKGGILVLNQVVLVGRLTEDPTLINTVNGKKVSSITLAVQRTFKNQDGIYEADFIRCILWNAIAASTTEYCHKGDIVGVKGRIQTSSYEDEKGNKVYTTEVIAEKVTFLSSKKQEENKEA
jgi:single-strand DNA-binding protein